MQNKLVKLHNWLKKNQFHQESQKINGLIIIQKQAQQDLSPEIQIINDRLEELNLNDLKIKNIHQVIHNTALAIQKTNDPILKELFKSRIERDIFNAQSAMDQVAYLPNNIKKNIIQDTIQLLLNKLADLIPEIENYGDQKQLIKIINNFQNNLENRNLLNPNDVESWEQDTIMWDEDHDIYIQHLSIYDALTLLPPEIRSLISAIRNLSKFLYYQSTPNKNIYYTLAENSDLIGNEIINIVKQNLI